MLSGKLVIAAVAICGNADATSQDSSNLMGLTKSAVVQRLGFPTNAHLVPSYAQGGPGYEIWQYYQRSPSGTVEIKDVVFGNQPKNLGHVFRTVRILIQSELFLPKTGKDCAPLWITTASMACEFI